MFLISTYVHFIIYVFSLSLSFSMQTKIVLSFKRYYENIKESNFITKNYLNYLGTELKVGSPSQSIIVNFNSSTNGLWLLSSESNLALPTYDMSASSSAKASLEHTTVVKDPILEEGQLISDIFYVNQHNLENIEFYLGTKVDNFKMNSGVIGLDLTSDNFYFNKIMFIKQLKQKDYISSYGFYLQYDNEDSSNEGELIIGEYPHISDSNYPKDKLVLYRTAIDDGDLKWGLTFSNIQNNGTPFEIGTQGFLKFEYGFIIGTYEYNELIYETYFKEYMDNGKCQKIFSDVYNASSYSCNSEIALDKFPLLFFNVDSINKIFNFTGKDLFVFDKEKNIYNFMVVFGANPVHGKWILGAPFLRRYTILFDSDRKIIGVYNIEKIRGGSLFWVWMIIIVMILLIGFMVYYLIKRKKMRRYKGNTIENKESNQYVKV